MIDKLLKVSLVALVEIEKLDSQPHLFQVIPDFAKNKSLTVRREIEADINESSWLQDFGGLNETAADAETRDAIMFDTFRR
jgi:hypothetical protein